MTKLNYIESKYLYLSSKNRNNGDINKFTVFFPNALFTNNNQKKKILKVNLQDMTINHEWANIDNRCNSFLVNGVLKTITEGSPSVYQLRDNLNTLLSGQYTVTYNIIDNKFTFLALEPANTITPLTCGHLLGLVNNTIYTGTITSVCSINVQYEHTLYLNCDFAVNSRGLDNITDTHVASSTILAKVPISGAPYDNIVFNSFKNVNEALEVATYNGIDSASFWIITERGYIPTLYHDWVITIKVECYEEALLSKN